MHDSIIFHLNVLLFIAYSCALIGQSYVKRLSLIDVDITWNKHVIELLQALNGSESLEHPLRQRRDAIVVHTPVACKGRITTHTMKKKHVTSLGDIIHDRQSYAHPVTLQTNATQSLVVYLSLRSTYSYHAHFTRLNRIWLGTGLASCSCYSRDPEAAISCHCWTYTCIRERKTERKGLPIV